jgi:hypothetical protein
MGQKENARLVENTGGQLRFLHHYELTISDAGTGGGQYRFYQSFF